MAKAIKDKKTVIVGGVIVFQSRNSEAIEEKVNELMDLDARKIIVRNENSKTVISFSKDRYAQNYSKENCVYELVEAEKEAKELEANTTKQV